MYSIACWTVVIFSASSSGISVSNSSSSAITSSTVSSESAPRSSTNDDSFLISASLTPSCSATIFLTRCSTFSMPVLRAELQIVQSAAFYQYLGVCPKTTFIQAILPDRIRIVSLSHVHATVDVQRGAGDVGGAIRHEESHRLRDVLGRTEMAQR